MATYTQEELETSEAYWMGILASAVGHYLTDGIDKRQLRGYYRDFLCSPVCDKELRQLLPR